MLSTPSSNVLQPVCHQFGAEDVLLTLDGDSVDFVISSPPYFDAEHEAVENEDEALLGKYDSKLPTWTNIFLDFCFLCCKSAHASVESGGCSLSISTITIRYGCVDLCCNS